MAFAALALDARLQVGDLLLHRLDLFLYVGHVLSRLHEGSVEARIKNIKCFHINTIIIIGTIWIMITIEENVVDII